MAVTIKNPITIVNTGGQNEPTGNAHITAYDRSTGVITGDGFGATAGFVYMLDRDTNTYVSQPVSSWSDTSIRLTTPLDLEHLEGYTSIVAVLPDGLWSTKIIVDGDIPITSYGKVYVRDRDTGQVHSINLATSADAQSINGYNSRKRAINGETVWTEDIVGVQFGQAYDITTLGTPYYIGSLTRLNQPIKVPASLTSITQQSFLASNPSFNQPIILNNSFTQYNNSFMSSLYSFNQPIVIPEGVTKLGSYFLSKAFCFDQKITLPSTLTSIGNNFLDSASSFNQPLEIPQDVTSIGSDFLASCYVFNQPITLPPNITSTPSGFLNAYEGGSNYDYVGMSFNQPIIIPEGVTTVSNNFLVGCSSFNSTISLPSTLTKIGSNFLKCCVKFNRPLSIPNTVTSIGNCFIGNDASTVHEYMTFDQQLTLPSSLTSIGESFLRRCSAFSKPLTIPSSVTSIGANFMSNTYCIPEVTLPSSLTTIGANFMEGSCVGKLSAIGSSVTSIGANFLSGAISIGTLEVNTTVSPTDNKSLSSGGQYARTYIEGITLTGTGATTWCTNLPNSASNPYRNLIDGTA